MKRDQMRKGSQFSKNSSGSISLRCLSHPYTLLSIGLLLINDHIFKHMAPSALTGKLSDFAGLFFFPFLLATFISLPLSRSDIPSRRVAKISIVTTFVCFSLIKTSPFANTLMVNALEVFLGNTQIVRDPTDLIALVVLWPTWRLWASIEQEDPSRSAKKSAYMALGLASLATLATSPCIEPPSVLRLVEHENIVYALAMGLYTSTDGVDWQFVEADQIPAPIYEELRQSRELPMALCVPEDPQTCYRIAKDEQVLISRDGGETWETLWSVPLGRRQYIERAGKHPSHYCRKSVDLGPYDMVIIGSGGSHELIVAMGNEGVLVKDSNGELLRQPVGESIPTAFVGFEPTLITIETLITFLLTLISLLGISNYSWNRIPMRGSSDELKNQHRSWVRSPMKKLIFIAFLVSILVYETFNSTFHIPAVVIPIAVIAFTLTWWRMAQVAQKPEVTRNAAITTLLTSTGVLLGGWGPFALWTIGVFPVYLMAVGVALIVVIGSLIWGIRRIKRLTGQQANQ